MANDVGVLLQNSAVVKDSWIM